MVADISKTYPEAEVNTTDTEGKLGWHTPTFLLSIDPTFQRVQRSLNVLSMILSSTTTAPTHPLELIPVAFGKQLANIPGN